MEKTEIEVDTIDELMKVIDECPEGTILEISLDEDGDEDGR